MNEKENGTNPVPKKIGLCLSGGGYRAAGYHLGTMDYLDRLGLLEKVTMLSTVSGGTFIGAKYTLWLIDKKKDDGFTDFFNGAYAALRDSDYIHGLLEYLNTERPDRPGKRRNLIQAAAEMYANTFLYDEKNEMPYLFGKILDADDIHLHTVIFNTTCFFSGLNFRFQKSKTDFIGTEYTNIAREDAKHIRVADIAAASSCFPGGFEPLAFMGDFVWPDETYTDLLTVPLMDGGVADNVGLNSLRQANERQHDELDLIIMSDVDPKPINLYPDFPLKPKSDSFFQKESQIKLTLNELNWISIATIIVLILTGIGVGVYGWRQLTEADFDIWEAVYYSVALVLSFSVALGIHSIRRMFRNILLRWFDEKIRTQKVYSWDTFKHITLGQATNMIKLRLSSIFAMTSNVFMRCIRKLSYDHIYCDPKYKNRLIANLIYDMTDSRFDPYFDHRSEIEPHNKCKERLSRPSQQLMNVIDEIDDMSSTLWWENPCQLPCLIAAGQITICFKLMKHIIDTHELNEDCLPVDERVRSHFEKLVSDWDKLVEDPFLLVKERYPEIEIPDVPHDCKNSRTKIKQ